MEQEHIGIHAHSLPASKIALFRSLFRGREDVYPRRFENHRTNCSGYSPACSNEWVRGVCEKPKIKCATCSQQRFLAITDEVVRWHLLGKDGLGRAFVMGVYPKLRDETCFFLTLDLDKMTLGPFLKPANGLRYLQTGAIMTRLATIPENEPRVLLATGRFIGEGFDDARLDTLFLTLPVSWRGTIAQYVGRLHRSHERKREVMVYDYADLNVPMLARMFDRRCQSYEAVGYRILLPASAVPGWPFEVPLPVDPRWKRHYAGSVQRLIRDGVDKPLATLFT